MHGDYDSPLAFAPCSQLQQLTLLVVQSNYTCLKPDHIYNEVDCNQHLWCSECLPHTLLLLQTADLHISINNSQIIKP